MNEIQKDALKEIGNIGTGNAATALSQLLQRKIDMQVPNVELCGFNDLADYVGKVDDVMVGILIGIDGNINGMMMFLVELKSAELIVEKLLGREHTGCEFSELELSVLQEMGNIIAGSYFTALSTFTNLTMVATVPSISIDMLGAFLNVPAIQYGEIGDQVLLIENDFGNTEGLKGYFLFIPDLESYQKIFASLGLQ